MGGNQEKAQQTGVRFLTDWQLPNSHRDVKYSTGNTVNNIVITIFSARWVMEISGEHSVRYMIS